VTDGKLTLLGGAPDVIPIREGEDFDQARLAAYLRAKLPDADRPLVVEQFSGGAANLTYLLRYGETEYVLRRPPLGPVAPTAHDMAREYRVLSVLYKGYPLAPRAFLYCDDAEIIGAPFFVMERRVGVVIRRVIPQQFGGGKDPAINRRISEVLIDTLAGLHSLDPGVVGLADLGKPAGYLRRQIDGWHARYERSKTRDFPLVAELVQWLREHMPPSPPPTLVHNDWKLDNIMFAADDPGRCVAVFDWDMCTLGDPLVDLGALLTSWVQAGENLGSESAGVMPSTVPGFLTRREAVARYAVRRNIDASCVHYYYVFGLFRTVVVLQQIYYRYHVGQTKDQRFAPFEQLAELVSWRAKQVIDEGTI